MEKIFADVKYHPVLENFPEYGSLKREKVTFNQSEKFGIPELVIAGKIRYDSTQVVQSGALEVFSVHQSEQSIWMDLDQ